MVSLYALHGIAMPRQNRTMKVLGFYKKMKLTILMDSGSTHNFLDVRVAKQVGGPIQKIPRRGVLVANGEQLDCDSMIQSFSWMMQGKLYSANMLLMPIKGRDMILGMKWLTSLGSVLWDFAAMTMQFTKQVPSRVFRKTLRRSSLLKCNYC
ncbi:hypothetical protein MLD38_021452 [Melastoma candidum]|uniref:Uncharacterized protein n=1 Tax=Melastoma candidum TaxID=119954 RepID=A0ACB9QP84_9MYRT|nr:hypothetical protein MLD38_021452 [Melastoma candidum]